ncbi:protein DETOXIFICATION 35-like [Argentina anserina]|uniref:protein DETOXIFICATION 35-like n=1 Tax=Argentina anserina TaxID=57926 RepID=UPI0021765956|nr:protein DETOXIFICATION 35-like [Potentilla anserina]
MDTQEVPLLSITAEPELDYAPVKTFSEGMSICWKEAVKLWKVAAPVAFTTLFQYLIQSITTIFVGHLGDLQLSAISLAHNVINAIAFGFLMGMANALGTLCGQAYGAGQFDSLGIYMQRSSIILWITCMLLSLLYIFATPFLKILGQQDIIAEFAGKYSLLIIPQMFSFPINLPTQKFLQAQSKVGIITWISFVALVTHTGLLYLFVSVLGWGVNGAAVAYNITYWGVAVGQFVYAAFFCKEGWNGFSWLAFKDIWAFAWLSLSSCMMFCLEMWYFMSLNLLAGQLENAVIALGSFSICLNFQSWEIMILAGINAAISIRVSNELGMGHPRAAKYSICVAVLQSLIVGTVSMTFIFISRDYIASVFTDSEVIQQAVARLAYFVGVTMLLNSVAQVLTGVAIGGGWQVMVAYINLAAYYLFGLPFAVFLGFKANLGPMGLYGGIICGCALQILFLLIMTSRINWDNEVEQTTKRIKRWGSKEIKTEKTGSSPNTLDLPHSYLCLNNKGQAEQASSRAADINLSRQPV